MNTIRLAFVCLLCFAVITATAQETDKKGIRFFEGSWKALLDTAQQLQKPVFIDVYTSWCGPCKLMDRNIFTADKVGEVYNAEFVNYRLDAEKGEGVDIARKFNVKAYPTFLYLNSGGYLLHKRVGEQEEKPFVQTGKEALQIAVQKDNLASLEERFDNGARDTGFLHAYLDKLKRADMDNSKVLDAYFNGLSYTQMAQEQTMVFLGKYLMNTQTAALGYFLAHYDGLSDTAQQQVAGNMYRLCSRGIAKELDNKNVMVIKQLLQLMDKLPGLDAGSRYNTLRMKLVYYDMVRDYKQLITTGYALTAGLMDIPVDSMRTVDAAMFADIMQPFLTGAKDSASIPGFSEERKLAEHIYTKEVCGKLYTVIKAFTRLPDTEKSALHDALLWVNRICLLDPEVTAFSSLRSQLEKRL
ncbi:Thioredoxin [Filimonas lacunae]|uniref:Thioredoxin n=1 Tax=Filimonas lacunae TaxID=477680 RepID=A0A173MEB6_9BACT|nr:thioredoxin family protein [Filimonas lacunae]BAV05915.1 disulphide-isomerase [Filimonas lacunae]SIT34520.1 Thioredoxin [Filimonas lacunae]